MSAHEDAQIETMPAELHLAAIVSLLSSAALHGPTRAKVAALRAHLEAAALCREPLDPHLRQALEDAFAHWLTVEVADRALPASGDGALPATPARLLH